MNAIQHIPGWLIMFFILLVSFMLFLIRHQMTRTGEGKLHRSAEILFYIISGWLALQAILSIRGVYSSNLSSLPPRILVLGIAPAAIFILCIFLLPAGRRFVDRISLKSLTLIHTVRIPLELILYVLALHKVIPELMTFEGRNFDIFSGISAPVAACMFERKNVKKTALLCWNLICLGLLLNVVAIGLLSSPTPLQQWSFDQPNLAVLHFPFSWIPTFLVPLVLFAHLASIRQLLKKENNKYPSPEKMEREDVA